MQLVIAILVADLKKKKYIIFDFDGTLACTNDIIVESWQACFEHFLGYVPEKKQIERYFGETLKHTIEVNFPNETFETVCDFYRSYQNAHGEGKVYLFDGIRELIDELHERGYVVGVATSRTTSSFWKYMKELGVDQDIDGVVAAEDVTKHKPDPEAVVAALEKLGGSADRPEEAIMIGDTKFDIGSAMNAGVDSVLVEWSHYVDEEDMLAAGFTPTYRIKEPKDLLDLI